VRKPLTAGSYRLRFRSTRRTSVGVDRRTRPFLTDPQESTDLRSRKLK